MYCYTKSDIFQNSIPILWIIFVWLCNKIWFNKCNRCWASDFAKKADIASLKLDTAKLDIDELEKVISGLSSLKNKEDKLVIGKLKSIPVDLSKLSDVVKIDVVKKSEYDKLFKKINNIKTIGSND